MRTPILASGLVALALLVAACAATPPAPPAQPQTVDQARATEIASVAMAAFNEGDYAGWSRAWSPTMKSAIPEDAFRAWRSSAVEQFGAFVQLGTPTRSSRRPGTYRWSFPVTFERGSAVIGFAFADGRDEVEGVFVE